jgi:uncharacterized protein YjdB
MPVATRSLRPVFVVLAALASACIPLDEMLAPDTSKAKPDGPSAPNGLPPVVVLATSRDSLFAGTSLTLAAAVAGGDGTTPLTWRSTNPSVADVTSSGVVIALEPGTTSIIAQAGPAADTATIVVRSPVQQISLEPGLTSLPLNTWVQFIATVDLNAGAGGIPIPLSWRSSDPSVLSITASGRATAVAPGSATVTVESFAMEASIALTVVQSSSPASVFRIEVEVAPSSLVPGQKGQAYAVVYDSLGNVLSDQSVTWSTSNPSVATVSSTGEVTALTAGPVEVRAWRGDRSGGKAVTVAQPTVARVEVSLTSPSIVGDTVRARATVYDPSDKVLQGRTVTWSTQNPQVASISTSGLLTALSAGTTAVSATVDGVVGEKTMTVQTAKPVVTTVSVSLASDTLAPGTTTQATAVARDASGVVIPGVAFVWSSSNTAVATVNASGVVSAVAAGSATITATGDGKSGSDALTVKVAASATISSVTVTFSSSSISVGQSAQATATARDASGAVITGQAVTWSISSGQAVATISSGGVVTGVSAGTASIRAVVGGVAGNASISVTSSAPTTPSPAGPAQLPQATVDVSLPAQTGKTITVNAGDDLQQAINSAQPGDVVVLQAGATFIGNFTLPKKTGTGWIVIRTSTPDQSLPVGTRVTPQQASLMPKILTPNYTSAILTTSGSASAYYRLIGLEVGAAPGVAMVNTLVWFGWGDNVQTSLSQVPHHLILDRSYVHGTATLDLRRCVVLNSAHSAVIDSYLSECHSNQGDAQAIVGWNGPGPFRIQNNYLEGSTMGIMFGGATTMPDLVPSDIEIRGNYLFKPLAWKGKWVVKNIIEIKSGQRILVEGNLMEGSWLHAQTFAITTCSVGAAGQTWHKTTDFTFRYNVLRYIGAGFNLCEKYAGATTSSARLTFQHNIIDHVNSGGYTGDGILVQVLGAIADLYFNHNTILSTTGTIKIAVGLNGGPYDRFVFTNNLLTRGQYGLFGSGEGQSALTAKAPGAIWNANVMIGTTPSATYPPGTYFSTLANVGFVNYSGGDYALSAASPYRGKATDGSDIGADMAAIKARVPDLP